MSRLSRDRLLLVDTMQTLLLAGFAAGVSDPSALTAASLAIVFTTDNPNVTANRAIVVADGDALSNPEQYEMAVEIKDAINKAVADVTAARSAVASLVGANVFDIAQPAAMTMGVDGGTLGSQHIGFTYTTDAPVFTLNGTTTIADGDLTTAPEFHEFAREASRTLALLRKDIGNVHERASKIIGQKGFAGVTVVPALSAATFTVTYTTDAPVFSANQTTTFADGDGTISVAERNDFIGEAKDQLNKILADVTSARTALNSWLAFADIA